MYQDNAKINVLHIIAGLPLGGAENILHTLAKNSDRKIMNLIFCCLDEEGVVAERIGEDGFKVVCLREERFRYGWRQLYNLYRVMKDNKIDIVHTHLYKADFSGRLVAFIAGITVICKSEHTVQHPMKFGVWSKISLPFYNIMRLIGANIFLDKITDAVIYDTKYARKSFIGKRFNPEKHYVVTGGLAESRLSVSTNKDTIRDNLGFLSNDFIIIIVARLIERKGHKYVFEAIDKMSIDYPNIKLLVVGDGHLREKLERLAVDINISNRTLFVGKVRNVQEYIKISDVFVLPSWREALGIVFLEAMYLGVPVIGANEAGIPEIIEDGVSGYLVRIKDSEMIKRAIIRVMKESETTQDMIKNARSKVDKEFSERNFTRRYEEIYTFLLGKKRNRLYG